MPPDGKGEFTGKMGMLVGRSSQGVGMRSWRYPMLAEDRDILIYLPQDYDQSEERYPVLYLLDGEWHFVHTSGIVQFLARPRVEKTPKMMVVAVVNTSRGRDFSPSTWPGYKSYTGGAGDFIEFLKKELIPFVDRNYRTQSTKILAGHSLAGTFSLYTSESTTFELAIVSITSRPSTTLPNTVYWPSNCAVLRRE